MMTVQPVTKNKNMILVLTEGETDALRGMINACISKAEGFAKKDLQKGVAADLYLFKLMGFNSNFESFQKKVMESIHLAGFCKDPNCKYQLPKKEPLNKND